MFINSETPANEQSAKFEPAFDDRYEEQLDDIKHSHRKLQSTLCAYDAGRVSQEKMAIETAAYASVRKAVFEYGDPYSVLD